MKKLKTGKSYQFKVIAYRKSGKKTITSAKYSNTVTAVAQLAKPKPPTDFAVGVNGEKRLELTWTRASNVTGYQIASYDAKTKQYKTIGTTKNRNYLVKKLKAGQTYSYAVRSYRKSGSKVVYSEYTKVKSGVPVTLSAAVKKVRSCYYYGVVKKTVTVYNYTKKKNQKIKKGTKVISAKKSGKGYTKMRLTNGQQIKIKMSYVSLPRGLEYNSKSDYSTSVKEAFINTRNLSSSTKWLIWISQYRARVNVFYGSVGKWKLKRTFKVVIGRTGSVKGIRRIYSKTPSGKYGNTPILYWSKYGNAFHQLLYGVQPGRAASDGCIRCPLGDLRWMYNNIPVGTRVYSY